MSQTSRNAIRSPLIALACVIAGSSMARAQGGNGSLSGQVFCSDKQKPARFATVSLVPDVTEPDNSGGQNRRGFGSSMSTTAADGTFQMKDVQAGVYDVQVMLPGYIQPIRQLNIYADSAPAMRQTFLSMITRVTIQAGQVSTTNVTAYRGADLLGAILYDDGTPAAGITVSAMIALSPSGASADSASISANASFRSIGSNAQTDDRGRYHLAGLADGTYTIQAVPRSGGLFPVFLGNTIDRGRATLVTVKAGEERAGLDMLMNLTDLHHVRGFLTTASNHPLPNASISLALSDNAGSQLSAITAADGSFSFAAVPDGKYSVSAGGAFDPDARVSYKNVSTQITVAGSDITDVVMTPPQ